MYVSWYYRCARGVRKSVALTYYKLQYMRVLILDMWPHTLYMCPRTPGVRAVFRAVSLTSTSRPIRSLIPLYPQHKTQKSHPVSQQGLALRASALSA